jgi:hypothetical protein
MTFEAIPTMPHIVPMADPRFVIEHPPRASKWRADQRINNIN